MRFTQYLAASALAAFATAQTFTECDPTKKECPNNPAMAANFETDFKAGADKVKGWKQTAGSLKYTSAGADFTISKKGESPTIQSETYLHFGYVEVKCKAAPGQGIISSIVLQSEDLDEVDWEFIGTVTNKVQMNYFGKGNVTTYDRMIEANVPNTNEMHTYALDWTAEKLDYIIDGTIVRTLKYGDANGGKNYPQTPSTVRLGIWAGGDADNEKGVIEWAGGKTDYSKAPFSMTIESVKVKKYSPGKEYKWTDKSGSWQSIEVVDKGNPEGAPQNSVIIAPTATASGKGLQSEVNVPTSTAPGGSHESGKPAPSATGDVPAPSNGSPQPSGGYPGAPHESKTCTSSTAAGHETPCSCGIATVTVTGNPPPPPASPPPAGTPPPPPPPADVPTTLIPSTAAPVESTSAPIPPPVTVPIPSLPPYPTPSSGIVTDANPPPVVPIPSAPTGSLPGGNATTSASIPEFTGAASANKVGALAGLAAAAILLI